MRPRDRLIAFILSACVVQFLVQQPAPSLSQQSAIAAKTYTLSDLSLGATNRAQGPNLSGQIVAKSGPLHGSGTPFIATPVQRSEVIGQFFGRLATVATGINDAAAIVGYANTGKSVRAFLRAPGSGFQDLSTLPGDTASQAFGVNNRAQVVGLSYGPQGPDGSRTRAFLWNPNTGMQNLGTLPGRNSSGAFAINDNGAVVGGSGSSRDKHAFLWRPGSGMQDLGTLPGDSSSEALDINNRGDVVGHSTGPAGTRAFLWTSKEGMRSLGTLPGGTFSRAVAINARGLVVGSSRATHSAQFVGGRAFIWSPDTGMQDLNALIPSGSGVVLMDAVGINARGQIAALGRVNPGPHDYHEGPNRLFLLTPGNS